MYTQNLINIMTDSNFYKKLNKLPLWITNKPDMKKLKRLSNKTFKVMKEKMNGA